LHKTQLASDRTSCRSSLANQMRLILHTAAYWLILTVRDTIPATHALATAEFTTIRLRLLKLGARVAPSNPSRQPPAPTKPIRSSSATNAAVKLVPTPTPGLLATLYQSGE
jgi:hypothetical protein